MTAGAAPARRDAAGTARGRAASPLRGKARRHRRGAAGGAGWGRGLGPGPGLGGGGRSSRRGKPRARRARPRPAAPRGQPRPRRPRSHPRLHRRGRPAGAGTAGGSCCATGPLFQPQDRRVAAGLRSRGPSVLEGSRPAAAPRVPGAIGVVLLLGPQMRGRERDPRLAGTCVPAHSPPPPGAVPVPLLPPPTPGTCGQRSVVGSGLQAWRDGTVAEAGLCTLWQGPSVVPVLAQWQLLALEPARWRGRGAGTETGHGRQCRLVLCSLLSLLVW